MFPSLYRNEKFKVLVDGMFDGINVIRSAGSVIWFIASHIVVLESACSCHVGFCAYYCLIFD